MFIDIFYEMGICPNIGKEIITLKNGCASRTSIQNQTKELFWNRLLIAIMKSSKHTIIYWNMKQSKNHEANFYSKQIPGSKLSIFNYNMWSCVDSKRTWRPNRGSLINIQQIKEMCALFNLQSWEVLLKVNCTSRVKTNRIHLICL